MTSTSTAPTTSAARWVALAVISLATLMDVLDNTIMNIALPNAQADLGFDTPDRQWIVTGYAIAFGSLLLFGGRLADSVGRKRMFMIGVTGFAVASAVGGAATGFAMLLNARVLQGIFAALLAPAALSLLSTTFADNPTERGRAFGIFGAVSGTGGAIGLLLGGALTESLSWRWCLYVNVAIAVVALAGATRSLTDTARPARTPLDLPGTVTAAVGLVGLVFGLGNAATYGWTNLLTIAPTTAGLALLVAFVLIERRTRHPLLPLTVVLDRVRGTAYLTLAICGTGMFAIFLFLTYYLRGILGLTPVMTGVAFLPMIAATVIGAVVSGTVLLPRTGPRPIVPAGCLLAAIGMVIFTGITTTSGYAAVVLPALIVTGLGFGLIFGPVQNAATSGITEHAGVASALVSAGQQIGGAIGTAAFSSLAALAVSDVYLTQHPGAATAATLHGDHTVFWTAAGVFTIALLTAALLFRSGPLPLPTENPPVEGEPARA